MKVLGRLTMRVLLRNRLCTPLNISLSFLEEILSRLISSSSAFRQKINDPLTASLKSIDNFEAPA